MKKEAKGSYYVVPQHAVFDLNLESGPLRDIYSIIYGFSQDGESGCECTLQYFMDWTKQSRATVKRTLAQLEEAGLIIRVRVGMGRGGYVKYMTNLAEVDQIKKGFKLSPFEKGFKNERKGFKNAEKGVQIEPQDNNIIIYKNIFFFACAQDARALLEEEKKNFFILFFFKNVKNPRAEVEAFIRANELASWEDSRGRKIDSPWKRLIWADGWPVQGAGGRVNSYFLELWKAIHNEAMRMGDPIVGSLMSSKITCESDKSTVLLTLPSNVREWLEGHISANDRIGELIDSFKKGRELNYIDLVL